MATATLRAGARRYGWLRRLELEPPLHLPLEAFRLGETVCLDATLEVDRPLTESAALFVETFRGTRFEQPVELGDVSRIDCRLQLGSASCVALDRVDARAAARRATSSHKLQRRQPAANRATPSRNSELTLAERLLLVLQPPLEALLEAQGLLEWPASLYPYQHDGVQALVESDALLLADDMGLGKTIQAIAALRVLIHLRRADQALVVAPASLLSQWRREFENWAPELRVEVVRGSQHDRLRQWRRRKHIFIVSYETLRQDHEASRLEGPSAIKWDAVVLDEAQKIKNRSTRASVACKSLQRQRSWALTGTPLENSLDELASIVEFLTPFADGDKPPGVLEGPQLLSRQRELQLRRKKHDVLEDLPAKSVNDVWLQLGGSQRETYRRAEEDGVVELKGMGERITISHVLALIQQLKRICNVCPTSGASAKLDDMQERLGQIAAEGQRALVFSQYTHADFGVHAVRTRLEEFRPLAYTGAMSAREKDAAVESFKRDPNHKALVLSLRSGGQGLNLQEASYVFHFDRWWNPAVERQAEDRAHRMGQQNAVTVYRYICEDTIEERIDEVLRRKQALFDEFIDNVTIDPGKLLGEKEIFGLFGLTPPKRGSGSATEELAE
jgi:SNF2 family DNA or RNA helicase